MERHEFPLSTHGTPLSQYGLEDRMDVCPKCHIAQGLVDHCIFIQQLYTSAQQEQDVLRLARHILLKKIQPDILIEDQTPSTNTLQVTPLSHHVLELVLRSPQGLAFCRVSPTLDDLELQFSQGLIGVLEFVELLEHAVGIKDKQLAQLKTQAFRVAGDMGTALKLLAEHALPNSNTDNNNANNANNANNHRYQSMELLQCILEFFLDLILEDTGELNTLAFFWPQICNIHLQMLPATNAASLLRIELMEDFLLTVATQHSVHLAIELIWSHCADLEDSQTIGYCAKRKYAVLRFLCELESLLFDFEIGWGGGSVTVGQFLSPSHHQIACLKGTMKEIQTHRLAQTDRLSRSRRLDKLTASLIENANKVETRCPSVLAQEALRIAKNADYLSSHLAFTKRLCDIAEKLRFILPVEQRPLFLQKELTKLNCSGAMGGDPLNKVMPDHSRVVRIPNTEGHVFRSKERTPVLLLVELNDEGAENNAANKKDKIVAFPNHLPTDNDEPPSMEKKEEEKKETKEEQKESTSTDDDDEQAETKEFSEEETAKEVESEEPEAEKVDVDGPAKDQETKVTEESSSGVKDEGVEEKGERSEDSAKEESEEPEAETNEAKKGDADAPDEDQEAKVAETSTEGHDNDCVQEQGGPTEDTDDFHSAHGSETGSYMETPTPKEGKKVVVLSPSRDESKEDVTLCGSREDAEETRRK
jgi:hypothetical protein